MEAGSTSPPNLNMTYSQKSLSKGKGVEMSQTGRLLRYDYAPYLVSNLQDLGRGTYFRQEYQAIVMEMSYAEPPT